TGVCVLAALTVGAALSTAAAAEPEFLTKAVVGEPAPSNVPFTGTTSAVFFEGAISKAKITCTAGTFEGEATGAKTVGNVVIRLTGCETSGCKVNTEGQPEGVLLTEVLAGKLGGVTSTLPGIKLFSQAEGKGGVLLHAGVGGCAVKIKWIGE